MVGPGGGGRMGTAGIDWYIIIYVGTCIGVWIPVIDDKMHVKKETK